jgi:hypothetical protein
MDEVMNSPASFLIHHRRWLNWQVVVWHKSNLANWNGWLQIAFQACKDDWILDTAILCFFCSRFTLWRSSTAMQNGHVWQIIYTWVICHGYSMLNYQRPTMGTTCDVGPAQFLNWLVSPVAGQSITAHPQKRLWDVTWDLGFWWIWIILD